MIESSTAPELHPNEIVSGHSDVARLLSLLAKQIVQIRSKAPGAPLTAQSDGDYCTE